MTMRHFSVSELTHTNCEDPAIREVQANPPGWVAANLDRLVEDILDPFRDNVGPLHVNSGWRSPELNALQPLASQTSMHMQGLAADLVPLRMAPVSAMRWLVESDLPFDQAIFERHRGVWIHVGAAALGHEPRRQRLMMLGPVNGRPVYEAWNPTDPRLG